MIQTNISQTTATSGTLHPSLRERCEARRGELEAALASADTAPHEKRDIQQALSSLAALFTGDLDNIPPMVALELAKWLETSKYLGVKATPEDGTSDAAAAADDDVAPGTVQRDDERTDLI